MRIEVDKKKKAIEYFKYAHDWIARHQQCDTCDEQEWKGIATHLSNTIQFYIGEEETYKSALEEARDRFLKISVMPCMQNGLAVAQEIAEEGLNEIGVVLDGEGR